MSEIYKCLNPVGNQEPVDLYPLAPRLDNLLTARLSILVSAARRISGYRWKRN